MPIQTQITASELLSFDDYVAIRKERKAEILEHKRPRRVEIGPVACCYFESYQTMLYQIQEMLYIERGGDEQIPDELAAYNPMIPNGHELNCTVMFEVDDPIRRANFLSRLGGVEETMFFSFAGHEIVGRPVEDVDRTSAEGKASSVQFIHFPFTDQQINDFRDAEQVIVGFKHSQYAHMVILQAETVAALQLDFETE